MESIVKEIKVKGSEQTIKFSMAVVGDHLSFDFAAPARTLVDGGFKKVRDVWVPFGIYGADGFELGRKFRNQDGKIITSAVIETFEAEMKEWQFKALNLAELIEAGIAPEQVELLNSINPPIF